MTEKLLRNEHPELQIRLVRGADDGLDGQTLSLLFQTVVTDGISLHRDDNGRCRYPGRYDQITRI